MADRPSVFPRWASNDVTSPETDINNVVEPPDSKKNTGWHAFEAPARNFVNWLHRITNNWIEYLDDRVTNRNKVTDGDGAQLFDIEDTLITIYAVNKTTPSEYLYGVGYKASGSAPSINVVSNNVLTLGSGSSDGSQPVSGASASDVIIYGIMQK